MKKIFTFILFFAIVANTAYSQCTDNGTLKNSGGGDIFYFDNLINCNDGDVTIIDAGGSGQLIFRNSVSLNSLTINFQNGNKPITIVIEDGVTLDIANDLTFGGQPDKDKFLIVEGDLDVGETLDFGGIEFEVDGEGSIGAKNITGGGDTTCSSDSGGTGTCPNISVTEGCTGGGICNDSSLPIELISFEASIASANIELEWVTAKEENFSHFEIERSLDKDNWEQLGLVQGMGESLTELQYSFTDRSAPFGVIYYRLNAIDIDGSFEYSPVITIKKGFEGQLAVTPNPVANGKGLKILVPSNFSEELSHVALYDLSGNIVEEFSTLDPNQAIEIKSQLKSGLYILKVSHNGLQENVRVMIR